MGMRGNRYGRGFPPMASPFVAAALQVPIAGTAALTLPHPFVMVGHGAVGIVATGAMSLPHPITMVGSGAVGTGSIAGNGAMTLPHPWQLSGAGTVGSVVTTPTGFMSSVDLLARAKTYAQRPQVDESMPDATWYSLMSEANAHWVSAIAAVCPEVLYCPPTQIYSTDGGYTYTFGVDADNNPIYAIGHVEIRQSSFGREWIVGADYDNTADYIMSGYGIRFPGGKAKQYSNGPIARWVTPGGTVNATVQPTVNPPHLRMLIVARMLVLWASRGGFRDPTPWLNMENRLWYGDQANGIPGFLAELRTLHMTQGAEALSATSGRWWAGLSTGDGYFKV